MKVIFLDIDGVLNVDLVERDEYGRLFHTHFVENLSRIVRETDAKIVISSAWRMSGLDVMREMWQKRGLAGEVIGITPYITTHELKELEESTGSDWLARGWEIAEWLKLTKDEIQVDKYVILDDDTDMLDSQLPYYLQCSELKDPDAVHGYGLTKRIAERAIEILNS